MSGGRKEAEKIDWNAYWIMTSKQQADSFPPPANPIVIMEWVTMVEMYLNGDLGRLRDERVDMVEKHMVYLKKDLFCAHYHNILPNKPDEYVDTCPKMLYDDFIKADTENEKRKAKNAMFKYVEGYADSAFDDIEILYVDAEEKKQSKKSKKSKKN